MNVRSILFNPALPPLTCTARGRRHLAAVVIAARSANCGPFVLRGLCRAENPLAVSACSCLVQQAVLPAVAVQQALCFACLPFFACHAHCPSQQFAPIQLLCPRSFCLPPFSVHFASLPRSCPCAPGSPFVTQHVCKLQDCPVGSCNTGLQWRPVRRVHLTFLLFPAESMILGHG